MDGRIIGCTSTTTTDLAQGTYCPQIKLDSATKNEMTLESMNRIFYSQSNFDAPEGDEPLAIDMRGMGKGQIWINGVSIGRYWTAYATGNCDKCNYAGTFRPPKCQQGCGQPTQRW